MNKPHNPHCVCETCHQLRAYMAPVDEAKPEQEEKHTVSMAQIGGSLPHDGRGYSELRSAALENQILEQRIAEGPIKISNGTLMINGQEIHSGGFITDPDKAGKIDGAKVKLRYSQNRATEAIHNLMRDFEAQRMASYGCLSSEDFNRLSMATALLNMVELMNADSVTHTPSVNIPVQLRSKP